MLTVPRGAALYVGALVGPGLLLVPALAAEAAGPASIVAWAALLVLSAPLAVTFAALGVRRPVAGGVSAYVREGFGDTAAAVTGAWFLAAGIFGGPAVALIGGYYVADLTGSGTGVAGCGRDRDLRGRLRGERLRPAASLRPSSSCCRPCSSSSSRSPSASPSRRA
jgi:amino acid efflux transporter